MTIMNSIMIILIIGNIIMGVISPNKVGHILGWVLALIYYIDYCIK